MRLPTPPLLVITDRKTAPRPLGEVIEAVFEGGGRWLMLREKDLTENALADLAQEVIALAKPYGALVSVNCDARVAAECGAQGVHLPQGVSVAEARRVVGDAALLGVSAHSAEEAHRAAASGADYVSLSPIFLSESKPGYGPALGGEELRRIAAALAIPVVALGGVTPATAAACLEAGAAGIAVMGTVMRADDPASTIADLAAAMAAALPSEKANEFGRRC